MVWFRKFASTFSAAAGWNFLYGFLFSRDDFGPLGSRLSLNVLTLLIDGPKLVPGMISDQVWKWERKKNGKKEIIFYGHFALVVTKELA